MLKIVRNWELQDILRSYQASREYGLQVSKNYRAIQWYGAFAPSDRGIIYFIARQINFEDNVLISYDIAVDRIKYEKGQYLYDKTKLFDGILPNGIYFLEFKDSWEKYFTNIFQVTDTPEPMLCSGAWPCSSSMPINSLTVSNVSPIFLRQFDVYGPYYQFENL